MSRVHYDSNERRDARSTPKPKKPGAATDGQEDLVRKLQQSAGNAAVSSLLSQPAKTPGNGNGTALPVELQAAAERKLGTDLSSVRVHGDAAAADYAASMNADGVTVDRDIYLGSSASDVFSVAGRKTLVHELVHAAQVSGGIGGSQIAPGAGADSAAEGEARQIAARGLGAGETRPRQAAAPGVAHLKATDEDEQLPDGTQAQPVGKAPTAEELLNPPASDEKDGSPEPGKSGDNEGVVYEVTIMQPLREALAAVESQDWELAMTHLRAIGMRLLNYQLAYEGKDPLLFSRLQAARGWLGVLVQQLQRRTGDAKDWSDQFIADRLRENVADFEAIVQMFH